ncbi:MAG: ABC transporter ATP-binding protein [Reyranellaceae bacterium]
MKSATVAATATASAMTATAMSAAARRDSGISVGNLSHRFAGGLLAVRDASFTVAPGEFVVIVGPSGCGKTTILNIIAGLEAQQGGEVAIGEAPPRAGRHDIAYMFAQDALLPWRTVLDNVLFGVEVRMCEGDLPRDAREHARDLIAMVGLSGFETAYPRQLSHGMRQRVALARTFMMPSPVLLMDEPFGALDAHTKLMLEQGLLRLWDRDKRTVLFITHDLSEAIILADKILVCTARPGSIKSQITVDIERPRNINALQNDSRYHDYYKRIWGDLAAEMAV